MPTAKITKRMVDATTSDGKLAFYWDTELNGFGLKVSPKGQKTYVVGYRLGRGAAFKRIVIGRHGVWTPDQAREEARLRLQLVNQGANPEVVARRRKRHVEALTIAAVIDAFTEDHLKANWRTWHNARGLLDYHVAPAFRGIQLPDITRGEVVALLDKLRDRPAARRKVSDILNRLFRWAVSRGDIDSNPMTGMDKPRAAEARDRVLADVELALVWKASQQLGYPFGPMVRLLILTGQRLREVAEARWEEFDVSARRWTIPGRRAKNGEAQIVPLGEMAIAELASLPRDGQFLLSSRNTPPSGFSRAKRRLDDLMLEIEQKAGLSLAGREAWRLHDLRRTLATGMQRLGMRLEVVEAVLNHRSGSRGGIVGVYQRHDWADEKIVAMRAWEAHVANLVAPLKERGNRDAQPILQLVGEKAA